MKKERNNTHLSGENQIVEDRIVDGGESSAPWPLLLAQVSAVSGWFREDPPFGQEDNVLSTELLLQLPDKFRLDLLVDLLLGERNVDDNRNLRRGGG